LEVGLIAMQKVVGSNPISRFFVMSRDIVDTSTPSHRLVVATGIEGEPSDQLACVEVQDANVAIGHEEPDRTTLVGSAEADVMEPAVVAKRDGAMVSTLSWRTRKWASAEGEPGGRALTRAP